MPRSRLIACIVLSLAFLACNTLVPPRPAIEWDTDPGALLVSADTCCGMMYDPNGISDARLWGDGQLIWVEWDSKSARRVLTATLSDDEIKALVEDFIDAGFFGWKDFYEPPYQVYDAPSSCLRVTLTGESKSVCVLLDNGPDRFGELYSRITDSAGVDYVPTTGYLQATISSAPASGPVTQWPVESLGFSLKDAANGVWVEGEALELAWRIVNAQPFFSTVQEGADFYNLTLLIPGITRQQPPAP